MKIDINENYAQFILEFAGEGGLSSIVERLEVIETDEGKTLDMDLQPELLKSFKERFPLADIEDLNKTIDWVLLTAFSMTKDENETSDDVTDDVIDG